MTDGSDRVVQIHQVEENCNYLSGRGQVAVKRDVTNLIMMTALKKSFC